jgi:hypothetical protein
MDLYQAVILGFLAVGVVVLAGILMRLGSIKKSLETSGAQMVVEPRRGIGGPASGAAGSRPEAVVEPEPEVAASVPDPEPAAVAEPEPVVAEEPEPVVAEEPEPEPVVAEEPEPEPVVAEEPEPEPVVAEEPEPEPVVAEEPEPEQVVAEEPEPEPVVAEEPEPEQVVAEEPEPEPVIAEEPELEPVAVAGSEGEPQEEPFQRNGRWWFRRDEELLVYDEESGEWLPGEAEPTSFLLTSPRKGAATHAPAGETFRAASVATREREETPEEAEVTFAGGEATAEGAETPSFWKCATCGAVNGSTAATCRMCFSDKP